MFEQIGRAIDDLIEKLCIMMYRAWPYRRVYVPCWVSIYYWLHPEMFTKDSVDAFYCWGYLTDKQYKRYWDKLEQKWSE